MVKLLHTADWHLGRLFHDEHLTSEQRHVLIEGLLPLVRQHRPDAVVVAGDVYDRAVPPPEAVALLDEVLRRLVRDLGVPVVLIAGNHDSPDRLAFGAALLAAEGLHVHARLVADPEPLVLDDEDGPVEIWALPYAEPAYVREVLGLPELSGHDQAMRAMLARVARRAAEREDERGPARRVLVAHAFVQGGEVAESERPLSVGGASAVDPSAFAGFDLVLLGHLHRRQRVGQGPLHYAGSLCKYSFSEAGHAKSASLFELGAGGALTVQTLPLVPRRDLRCIEGSLAEVLARPDDGRDDDYLQITLTDRGHLFDPMGTLRQRYPNVLAAPRPALWESAGAATAPVDRRKLGDRELFAAFFAEVTGAELEPDEEATLAEELDLLAAEGREVPA